MPTTVLVPEDLVMPVLHWVYSGHIDCPELMKQAAVLLDIPMLQQAFGYLEDVEQVTAAVAVTAVKSCRCR